MLLFPVPAHSPSLSQTLVSFCTGRVEEQEQYYRNCERDAKFMSCTEIRKLLATDIPRVVMDL